MRKDEDMDEEENLYEDFKDNQEKNDLEEEVKEK